MRLVRIRFAMTQTLSGRVYRAGAEIGPGGCKARKCHRKGPLNLILVPPDLLVLSLRVRVTDLCFRERQSRICAALHGVRGDWFAVRS